MGMLVYCCVNKGTVCVDQVVLVWTCCSSEISVSPHCCCCISRSRSSVPCCCNVRYVCEHLQGSVQGFSLFCFSKLWMMGMCSWPRLNICSVCLNRHAADAQGWIVEDVVGNDSTWLLSLSLSWPEANVWLLEQYNVLFYLLLGISLYWWPAVWWFCSLCDECVCVSLHASAGSEEGERQVSGRSAAGSARDQEEPACWNHFHQYRVRCAWTNTLRSLWFLLCGKHGQNPVIKMEFTV